MGERWESACSELAFLPQSLRCDLDHKRMKASGAFQAEGVVNAHALSFPGLGNLEKGKEVM